MTNQANAIERLTAALADRYTMARELGAGGMATVYLARDIRHNRHVALKVLKPDLAAVIGTDRFFSEIEVTANLHHPHLLPLFDSGAAEGLLFYVMPYIEGETLRARLERERQLPVGDALHIATAVATALDYAHRHGVIHRDLKPENILLHEREPLVMDFGIALAVSNAGGARITQTGLSLGTPQYMSPEQATGDRVIDARTDIYSLGAVLYEMLTGDPPHAGTTVQAVVARVLTDKPRSIRASRESVPEHVELAVMRALAKLPADRFATAAAFADALEGAVCALVPATAQALVVQHSVARSVRASFTPRALAIGGAAVAAAVVLGAFVSRAMRTEEPPTEARFIIDVPDSQSLLRINVPQLALSPDGSRVVQFYSSVLPLYVRRLGQLAFDAVPGSDSAYSVSFSADGRHLLYWARPVGTVIGFLPAQSRLMRIPVEGGAAVKIADSASRRGEASWSDRNDVIFGRRTHLILVSADGGAERVLAEPDTSRAQAGLGWPQFLPGGKKALITIERRGGPAADSSYIGVVSLDDGAVTDLGIRGFTPRYTQGHLLYVDRAGQLFAVPFDAGRARVTGEPRVLADNVRLTGAGTDLSVANDGTILYTDGGPSTTTTTPGGPEFTIVRFDRSGRETVLDVPPRNYRDMRMSPDGERIALSVREGGRTESPTDIYLYTQATGQTRRFTRDGRSRQPVWTRDGKRIVYAVDDPSKSPPVRYVSEPWDQSAPPEPFVGADGAEYLELGPEGGYLAQVRSDSANSETDTHIFIAPMDSAAAIRPFAATGMRERWARLSPDGRWLAYHGHEIRSGAEDGLGGRAGRGVSLGGQQVSYSYLYLSPVPGPGARIQVSKSFGDTPMWSRDSRTLYYLDRPDGLSTNAMLTAARISSAVQGVTFQKQTLFRIGGPGGGRGGRGAPLTSWSPASLGTAEISPTGEFYFLRPVASTAGRGNAPAQPAPRVIIIVNGLTNARANVSPAGR